MQRTFPTSLNRRDALAFNTDTDDDFSSGSLYTSVTRAQTLEDEDEHKDTSITLGSPPSVYNEPLHPACVQWQPKLPRKDRVITGEDRDL